MSLMVDDKYHLFDKKDYNKLIIITTNFTHIYY